jgi:hypothetical protein
MVVFISLEIMGYFECLQYLETILYLDEGNKPLLAWTAQENIIVGLLPHGHL